MGEPISARRAAIGVMAGRAGVAAAAGVSIGAVQHHFPTKDDLLLGAFEAAVEATRARIAALGLGDERRRNLSAVARQLLPLDPVREREACVMVAFGARAAVSPALRPVQSALLRGIREEIADVLGGPHAATDATILLAVVDGLALHRVSAPRGTPRPEVEAALERALDLLLMS